jgi:hypothetical protein
MEDKSIKETRVLPCKLTENEILEYANDMAIKLEEKDMEERRKKEVVAEYTQKLTSLDATIVSLSNKVRNKEEHRDVECEWEFDWEGDTKKLIRLDTGEVVKKVQIQDYERQKNLIKEGEEKEEETEEI